MAQAVGRRKRRRAVEFYFVAGAQGPGALALAALGLELAPE